MTDHQLRDLLERAAPPEPDLSPAQRTDAVVRRGRAARRRDRVLVAGAGVAVLVTAVAVPVTLRGDGGGDHPDVATPAPTASPCPAEPVDLTEPGAALDLGAPGDVVAVRACPAAGEQGEPLPGAPLEGDAAAAFAADLDALPAYWLPDYCAAASVLPQPWALQIETSAGATYFLGSTMRSCSSVSIGGIDRGTDAVLAVFTGNVARQESGTPGLACPPGDRLADGAPTWNASFDPSTATAGVVCYRVDPMGAKEYDGTAAQLDDAQLATIRGDLSTHLKPAASGGMCVDTGPQRMVVLEDADGDQGAWVDDQCTGELAGPGGWLTPSPESEQAIADALNR